VNGAARNCVQHCADCELRVVRRRDARQGSDTNLHTDPSCRKGASISVIIVEEFFCFVLRMFARRSSLIAFP
jgi:hypothetical protein